MDSIRDRNGGDLTDAEDNKKRWQEYTEELKKKRMGRTRDILKKVGDINGIFHVKMGTTMDRNGKDLTEAEDIRKRWQE